MDFGQKLKNEISATNVCIYNFFLYKICFQRHKEKVKMTLMSSNRKLNGFTEKINILVIKKIHKILQI